MIRNLFLLSAAIVVLACNKKDKRDPDCPEHEYTYTSKPGTSVDTVQNNFTIVEGGGLLFEYAHTYNKCALAYDGGYTEIVVFQMITKSAQFKYTDDELVNANTFYRRTCFCADVQPKRILKGTIEGTLVSGNTWKIKASLIHPTTNATITFNGVFKEQ